MTKTTESVLFLFSPPMQACYSLSSAPTVTLMLLNFVGKVENLSQNNCFMKSIGLHGVRI